MENCIVKADDIKVSYFAQLGGGSIFKKTKPSAVWSLTTLYECIRSSESAKKATEYLRSLNDETKEKHFKAHGFDLIIPGGTLTSRSRGKNQVCPNGECCIDVDHISFALRESLFQNLIDDPELTVDLMFRSPRGHGLKIFLRYDPDEISYKDFYLSASNYLLFNYGVMADKACSDITHPCLIPWDDNAFINKRQFDENK
jgi:hypothetical protein